MKELVEAYSNAVHVENRVYGLVGSPEGSIAEQKAAEAASTKALTSLREYCEGVAGGVAAFKQLRIAIVTGGHAFDDAIAALLTLEE